MNATAPSAVCCSWCSLPIPGLKAEVPASGAAAADEYCCYGCRIAHAVTQEKGQPGTVRWTVVRLGLAIFFSMNLMAFTMTMWSLDVYDVQRDPLQQQLFEVFRWLSLVLSVPVFLLLGVPLLLNALSSRRTGVLTTDLLIVTGVAAAYGVSIVAVLRGSEKVYFEVGAAVLVMVTLGRWLEAAGRQKATEVLDQLAALLPVSARRLLNGVVQEIPSTEIVAGDCLQIRPGDRFPVDGVVFEGITAVDEQVFTGESVPVLKYAGDRVLAGTVNLDGAVVLRASGGLRSGSFAALLALLQDARLSRGRYQRLAEQVTSWFLPLVGVTAIFTVAWHWHGTNGPGGAIQAGLSVLLIACPCALGLATPLAVWTSLSTAARRQVLFRSGESIERLAAVTTVCFDKTGTLTTGHPDVRHVAMLTDNPGPRDIAQIIRLAAHSTHPCSVAIARLTEADLKTLQREGEAPAEPGAFKREGEAPAEPHQPVEPLTAIRAIPGGGIEASNSAGQRLRLGSPAFALPCSDPADDTALPNHLARLSMGGESESGLLTVASIDGQPLLAFLFRETLRPESSSAVAGCLAYGLKVCVLTGDRAVRAERLAHQLAAGKPGRESREHPHEAASQLTVLSGLSPAAKVRELRRLQAAGEKTAMVGDGINDAPALAVSDVGMALGCGADVSRNTADVCLLSNDPSGVPWAVGHARRTTCVIRRNLFWAFGYNTLGVAAAACGWLNPALAAALMIVSSLVVISNALTLLRDADVITPQSAGSEPRNFTAATEFPAGAMA
ncbi:MAG: heavy metal translocating P-type ATPase [Planctomycetota bacterium]